jgi:hypothetical protein
LRPLSANNAAPDADVGARSSGHGVPRQRADGRYFAWLRPSAIPVSGYHWGGTVDVPLAGGAVTFRGYEELLPIAAARTVVDLDARSLDVPVCAPLSIPGARAGHEPRPAIYRRPSLVVRSSLGDLWPHQCGRTTVRRIARGVGWTFALGHGVVAWIDAAGDAHLRTRRGTSRLWPSVRSASPLVLTGTRVVAMTTQGRVLIHRLH